MKLFIQRTLLFSVFLSLFLTGRVLADEFLILEPVVQSTVMRDGIVAWQVDDQYFISINDLARIVGFRLDMKDGLSGYFLDEQKKFKIDPKTLNRKQYIERDGVYYFSLGYYEEIFPLTLTVKPSTMELIVESSEVLPVTMKKNIARSNQRVKQQTQPGFDGYQFDERLFSAPLFDITYSKTYSETDSNIYRNDYYRLDASAILLGFDSTLSVYGNSPVGIDTMNTRLLMGRTFLKEPKTLELTEIWLGDLNAVNGNYFSNTTVGRGLSLSSFKNFVMSADKTITVTGVLQEGWEVALYMDNQFLGLRQQSADGRYEFNNVVVHYGLNIIKLVFYGPFGETRTEEQRYYSGTSPVSKGKLGYTIDTYQKYRYIFENEGIPHSDSDEVSVSSEFYYGLTDRITMMGGFSRTVDMDDQVKNYGDVGILGVISSASLQYNLLYGIDDDNIGHHVELQGDIYFADIFARYDNYGDLNPPTAYYGTYLKELYEVRLSGNIADIDVPYLLSYKRANDGGGKKFEEARARLSKRLLTHFYLTAENVWQDYYKGSNYIELMLSNFYKYFYFNAMARQYTSPKSYMERIETKFEYRPARRTYTRFTWTHLNDPVPTYTQSGEIHSKYKTQDIFSLAAGQLFKFGSITLSANIDTYSNYGLTATYNVSLGKKPDRADILINPEGSFNNTGAVYVKLSDERGRPVENVNILVPGRLNPVKTDSVGEAFVPTMPSYEKTKVMLDFSDHDDIALYADKNEYNCVLRPGTVMELDIKLAHKGGIEGKIDYTGHEKLLVTMTGADNSTVEYHTDTDGNFVFDGLNYGKYIMQVYDQKSVLLLKNRVIINEPFRVIDRPYVIASKKNKVSSAK